MSETYDIEAIRAAVVAQTDAAGEAGWMAIPVPHEVAATGSLRVPRGAFERWAVWRSGGEHLVAPWTPVSPQGVKMRGDDGYHTDWMLGAGLHPLAMRPGGGNPHWEALRDAAEAARSDVGRRVLGHSCTVLLQGPYLLGVAWHPAAPDASLPGTDGPPVAVLRDARPDWLALVSACIDAGGGAIVERGGEMAHLVAVLRGSDKGPLVRVGEARRLFPDGTALTLSTATGEVALRDDGRSPTAVPARPGFLATPVADPATAVEVHDLAERGAVSVEGTDVVLVPVTRDIARRCDALQWLVGSRRSVGFAWNAVGVLHAASEHASSQHLVVTLHPDAARAGAKLPRYSAGTRDWLGSPDLLHAAVDAPLAVLEDGLRREAMAAREARRTTFMAARAAEEERLMALSEAEFLAEVEAQAADEESTYGIVTNWTVEEERGLIADFDAAWRDLSYAALRRGTDMPPRRRPCDLDAVEAAGPHRP